MIIGKINKINFSGIEKKYNEKEAQIFLNVTGYFNVSSCNKLFDISLFDDIEFPVGKKSEDWYIMYKLIEKAGGLYYSSLEKYMYRQRFGSITKAESINLDSINAAEEVYEYFKGDKEITLYTTQSMVLAIIGIYNRLLCNGDLNKEQYRKLALKYKKNMGYKYLSIARKIQIFLFFYNIYLYNILFKIFDFKRRISSK